ncbi:MAG: nucleotide exchange factor GrpE [Alphaproteobacteria bacterium]|nr:nucleotide exchange factor GrpE [Alphaproteobacteria bacterium]
MNQSTDGKADPAAPDNPFLTPAPPAEPAPAPLGDGPDPAALQAELAQLKEQLLRTLADAENQRKRGERQLEDVRRYAVANFARDLIEVADNLERALSAVPAEARIDGHPMAGLVAGIEAVGRSLQAVFGRWKVHRLVPEGEAFDPNRHEAMFEIEVPGQPAGRVAQVMQPGYMIDDRLLRPARVAVTKGGAGPGLRVDTTA